MTSDGEPLPPGATPLDPDEAEGLIQVHIETRRKLNEAEEANIAAGFAWAVGRLKRRDPLTDDFLFELHRRTFDQVWGWAGRTRTTEKNIGVAPWEIRTRVRDLLADVRCGGRPGKRASRSTPSRKQPYACTIGWLRSILFQTAMAATHA
jgi:fido (protein-threonine AMPylation protein)